MRSVAALLLLCIALAIAQVPDLPDQFTAKVTFTLPFLGSNPGVMYYDYINGRARYDVQSPFGDAITIYRYDIETPTEYTIAGGQCEAKVINDTMNPMSIPPFATYEGSEDVDSVTCDHWSVDMLGFGTLDWFVSNSTDDDGKVTYQLVRFSESMIGSQFDFGATTPGPVDYSIFDISQYGCPSPQPPVTYTVAGYVKNAINNKVIPSANVQLGGTTVTADANGKYQFNSVTAGNYSITASASGFYSSTIKVSVVTDNIPAGTGADFSLSPTLASGQFRVVLTWGAAPRDLDAHLKTPGGCEVYYYRRQCGTASLDVDQRQGFGPETVTVNGLQTGTYTYYIANYSGEKPLTVSGGRIQVYGQSGLVADISVPTDGNTAYRYWIGFTVDQTGTVTVVNKLAPSV